MNRLHFPVTADEAPAAACESTAPVNKTLGFVPN